MSGPPAQFLDELHQLPDHEIIELLTQRLRGLRRISRDTGPVLPRVVHDRVRMDLVLAGRTLALHEIGPRRQDSGRLPLARLAVALLPAAMRARDVAIV